MKQSVHTQQAPAAIGPYSQAIVVGELLFVSGQTGVSPADGMLSEDFSEQCHQTLRNVRAILQQAGVDMDCVVKATVFLTDMSNFQVFNQIYAEYFPQPYPARSCVQVSALPKGADVEVETVACLK